MGSTSPHISPVMRQDGQSIGQMEAIRVSPMTKTYIMIESMDSSFLSVMKSVLNYEEHFELRYCVSFIEACFKKIVEDLMLSRYLYK